MKKIFILCIVLAFVFATKATYAQTEITFYTNMGTFTAEMYDTLQPITAGNFITLVKAKFYDGVIFHRVIKGFMIQGGDPTGTGSGGPGYSIPDEFDPLARNIQKSIAMANAGPNTGGSQFFINLVDNNNLNSGYPVFGIVTSNFSVVQAIGVVKTNSKDRPLTNVVMDSLRVTKAGPLAVNEEIGNALNVNIYPNPTNDIINIDFANQVDINSGYTLKISDISGHIVYESGIIQSLTSVNLSSLNSKGIYFIHLIDAENRSIVIKKFVLE
jgi:cyclophilin family peptidyl-prolyl cis-trans isomerase